MYYQGNYPQAQPPQAPAPRQKKKRGNRKMCYPVKAILIAAVAVAVAVAVLLMVHASNENKRIAQLTQEVQSVQNVFLDGIYVDGIAVGGMEPQQAIDAVTAAVQQRQNSWKVSLNYQGFTYVTLDNSTLGVNTDLAQVYQLLQEAYRFGHEGTLEQRKADMDRLKETPYSVYTTQSEMTDQQLNSILMQLEQYFEKAPSDASLIFFSPETNWNDPFGIQPESNGMHLDTAPLKEQILKMAAAGQSGDIELQPQIIAPAVTQADIRNQVALRGEGVTPVSSSSTTARTDNIRVALSRYNGLTVASGEKVSFNKTVGARTMENGFQYAIEYANGLNSWGIGGGVCQASTTVYLAALKAGLQITDRVSHSDAVSYTIFGQDATVYYSRDRKIDFVFKNNTNATIYIAARVETVSKNKYSCVVRIYGPSLGSTAYGLRTETVETLPAPLIEEYQKDTDHNYVTYTDEKPYLLREARDGFINVTYLQRYENGNLVEEKEISRDECKARGTLYLVGTQNR